MFLHKYSLINQAFIVVLWILHCNILVVKKNESMEYLENQVSFWNLIHQIERSYLLYDMKEEISYPNSNF